MATLSVEGFKDSEIFRFERPGYEKYPHDAVASFANLYRSRLKDPRALVIVAEDWSDAPDKRIVVGVGSWILPEGSPRIGQFVVPDVGDPEPAPDRDLCQRRFDLFTAVSQATEKIYFQGKVICDKFVVHPSYQRPGHGTAMLRWSLRLCTQDFVKQGVIPSHVGEPVYLSVGFEVIGEMDVPNDGEVEGFKQRVALCKVETRQ